MTAEYLTTLPCPHCGEWLVNVTRPDDAWPVFICTNAACRGENTFTLSGDQWVPYCCLHRLPESRCPCLKFGKVLAYGTHS